MIQGIDLHTRIFVWLVKYQFDTLKPRTLADLEAIWPPKGLRVDRVPVLGLEVGTDDYEEATMGSWARFFIEQLNRLPRRDVTSRWASAQEARATLDEIFAPRLNSVVEWKDPSTDDGLVRLVTHGLAAHMLTHVEGSRYEVDLRFMLDYPVRPGFVRCGARLLLELGAGDLLEPVSIEWARGESGPKDDDWELAKLAFRVAVATAGTVRDHAVHCHFLASNAFVVATRCKLRGEHPIRAFLRAFQFRTHAINAGALVTLIPRNAIFHRLFSFEWEGLSQLYDHAKRSYRMQTLPQDLEARGVLDLPHYPYGQDALGLWQCAHALTTRYLEALGGFDTPMSDAPLAAFHQELIRLLPDTAGVPPITTAAELATLLAIQIFVATAGHEQFGGAIGDYLSTPDFVVPTMVDGNTLWDCVPSRQTMIQGYMLGVLTNFGMPRITDNFAPLVPERTRPAVYRWITALGQLRKAIDARNATRAQPLRTFHPNFLEISVSI